MFTWLKPAAIALLALTLNLSVTGNVRADATGTWKWSFTNQSGQTYETTLKLKQDGNKLAGVIVGRDGTETAIADGQIQAANLSFKATRERNGQSLTSKYVGKLDGDAIKGKIDTERDGQTTSRDWEAKREKAVTVTGAWKWSSTNQAGDAVVSSLALKQEGGTVTGALTSRRGETAIEAGKLTGDVLSFIITRDRNGEKVITKYTANINGDVLKGKIESGTGDQARSRDWEAKREQAVNATGTWQWTMTLPDGQTVERKIRLKQDGAKLTGVSIYNDTETAIEEGTVQGGDVAFQVTRERDGNKFIMKYRGTLAGDSLKGKITGNIGGEDRSFDMDAKRVKE
jgi:hypothetical protein